MEGTRLGKYQIRARIGRGSAGTVYQAWDPAIARLVAIKVMPLNDPAMQEAEFRERFRREAQAAGRLDHPNIVSVHDYGETDDLAYIVMQYVDGTPLSARLVANQALPWPEVARIMTELLAGLRHSHENGVVHRDIKPANIVLTKDGQVKISDFGVAHLEDNALTVVGSIIGTPAYMAPEQVTGEPVDPRTDLYSAGVVLYQMLTGVRPFEGSAASIMNKLLHTPPSRPSEVAPGGISPGLDAIVVKALAKRPDQRFQSATDFAFALGVVSAPGLVSEATDRTIVGDLPADPGTQQPRPRIRTWLAAGAVLALGVGATWTWPWSTALPDAPRPGRPTLSAASAGVEAFDKTMRDWVAAHHVPAASLAIMRDDRLVLSRGYGTRAATDRVPLWSLSKAITAACVATFVVEGRLGFDDPIGPLLMSFFRWAGAPADDRLPAVTVGQLLSHRSGLPGKGPGWGFAPGIQDLLTGMRPEQLRFDMIARTVAGMRLQAAPGERYEYSNFNYLLLGEIIEAKAGKPYVDACRERVLDRAGIAGADLAPRWGRLTWAAGGWALSAPESLAFVRLLRSRQPDVIGAEGRAWLSDPAGKWTDDSRAVAYTLGVFLRPNPGTAWHWGSWDWHQTNAAGGAIDERSGSLFALRVDGTAWFASFDNISSDLDRPGVLELDRALWSDAEALAAEAPPNAKP